MMQVLTRSVRRCLTGRDSRYEFIACSEPAPSAWPDHPDLYLHVPFCRNLCPYCPYYKEEYDKALIAGFAEALKREVGLWTARLGGSPRAGSLYIGGGTPMLLGERLPETLELVRAGFGVEGSTAIELNPLDVTDANIDTLKSAGVDMVSLGVQSFDRGNLALLGRPYTNDILPGAITKLTGAGFQLLNLDLMFGLPGQSLDLLERDVDRALECGADQLTFYPLFTFPYTSAGRMMRLRRLRMPRLVERRRQYRFLHQAMQRAGMTRVTVWGFSRRGKAKYSSVTRERYIGLGPGAASYLPGQFLFNTFSVKHYCERLQQDKFPTSLGMSVTESMELYYWLYWRLYETKFSRDEFARKFAGEPLAGAFLAFSLAARLVEQRERVIRLTESGAFWIHWRQNQFILRYIDAVWSRTMSEPFPDIVRF